MDFKSQTELYLEYYNQENKEIIEESIRNNSASNRLQSIINDAEEKIRSVSSKEALNIKKALQSIKNARDEFLRLENSYKSASSEDRKILKEKYKELKEKYSYKLKKIHMPKGVAAAIIGATLSAITSVGPKMVNSYRSNNQVESNFDSEEMSKELDRQREEMSNHIRLRNKEKADMVIDKISNRKEPSERIKRQADMVIDKISNRNIKKPSEELKLQAKRLANKTKNTRNNY